MGMVTHSYIGCNIFIDTMKIEISKLNLFLKLYTLCIISRKISNKYFWKNYQNFIDFSAGIEASTYNLVYYIHMVQGMFYVKNSSRDMKVSDTQEGRSKHHTITFDALKIKVRQI